MKEVAYETNAKWAEILRIPASRHITLVKPSGTVSQLCGTSSGMHPRFAHYYLRRVTQDNKDPLTELMKSQAIPYTIKDDKTTFSFPIKSPKGSVCATDMGAIEQLELWKVYNEHWCDGNPSQTIYYTDDEFLDVQAWVWKHWNKIGGLSFFPVDDSIYDEDLQPYLAISEETYHQKLGEFSMAIDWSLLSNFESDDNTTGSQEMACAGGACEI
jgi:ribonucleoside-triphosphate reductase